MDSLVQAATLSIDTGVTNRGRSPPTKSSRSDDKCRLSPPTTASAAPAPGQRAGATSKALLESGASTPSKGGKGSKGSKKKPAKEVGVRKHQLVETSTWTPEETEMLKAAVALYKGKSWKKIAACFESRKTEQECMRHWRNVLNPPIVKGKGSWTPEEDQKLKDLVEQYGRTKWSYIGKFLPGRIGKQCRERWHNHLNPALKKTPWTPEEEKLIIKMRAELGNRWAKIARCLPGRSDNDVKNRWYASLRKRVEAAEGGVIPEAKPRGGTRKAGSRKKKAAGQKQNKNAKKKTKKPRAKVESKTNKGNNSARRKRKAATAPSPATIGAAHDPQSPAIALPPRKRARQFGRSDSVESTGDIAAFPPTRGCGSGKSTPVRPQKGQKLLAMAAYLDMTRCKADADTNAVAQLLAGLGAAKLRNPVLGGPRRPISSLQPGSSKCGQI